MIVHDAAQIGRLVRARRKDVGLTVAEAAELAAVSRRLLTELERGKRRNVGVAALLRVLEVLGMRVEVEPRSLPPPRQPDRERRGA